MGRGLFEYYVAALPNAMSDFIPRRNWCDTRGSNRIVWEFASTTRFYRSPWGAIAVTPGDRIGIFVDLGSLAQQVAPGSAETIMTNATERDGKKIQDPFISAYPHSIPAAEKDLVRRGGTKDIFVPLLAAERWLRTLAGEDLPAFDFADMRFGICTVLEETLNDRLCAESRAHADKLAASRAVIDHVQGLRELAE